MTITEVSLTAERINKEISKVLVGKEKVCKFILAAFFAKGHVLLEDVPGTGKSLLARSLAASIDGRYKRIQFTPDLLPTDVTGLNYFNQEKSAFVFREGPVFANIVLADEINRATPRTQSAMLESMEERQVSADGISRELPCPFFVIATQNPVESLGTFPLPEAQLDRFMLKLKVGYPDFAQELDMIDRYIDNNPFEKLQAVANIDEIMEIQRAVCGVQIHADIRNYMLKIIKATRDNNHYIAGASPRCTLSFMRLLQAYAAICGREYVTADDVKELAPFALGHRVIRTNEYEAKNCFDDIRLLVNQIDTPLESLTIDTRQKDK